ncbi:PA2169 family four-helix-bundle protein [Butyricicoccus faecihominis]|uniref:PA2169 family four-helix-bundle protein n=1 Tax=Butyricicoccaceae TaxID=3085642 RepID=UPI002479E72D|nr:MULTISPECIES: PA2169 family four-helix-bundle protein [Butyricicoccaceae]MCQ5130542.1 PA2169 family four-helix-bundle protein [Butyricicoccus faecihominis]WNX83980.1 PA2169 family four-helix-bundle protein [Agathobaculum sp. NTUH-O15-33]
MQDIELLQYVHETAEMGIEGLQNVTSQIENPKLRQAVESQIVEYQDIAQQSGSMLRSKGETPKNPGLMARVSSEVMSTLETLTDNSSSKIAEMVIQGNNMGITKGLKHLHDYAGDDKQVRGLAEKLLHTEQSNVEQMKPFL